MPMAGAAAPSHDCEVRQPRLQLAVVASEGDWISRIQLVGLIELGMALLRRVGAETADAATPVTVLVEHMREVRGVSSVDHEVGDRPFGLGVD